MITICCFQFHSSYFELCITMYLHDPIHSHVWWQTVFSKVYKHFHTHLMICFDTKFSTFFWSKQWVTRFPYATGHKCCEGGWSGVETSRGDLGALAGTERWFELIRDRWSERSGGHGRSKQETNGEHSGISGVQLMYISGVPRDLAGAGSEIVFFCFFFAFS